LQVAGVASDGQTLTIDYIAPPGQLAPFPENRQPPRKPAEIQTNGSELVAFVASFAQEFPGGEVDPGRVVGKHPAENIPVYEALARQFIVCQRWS
jgi:hypothetical protein